MLTNIPTVTTSEAVQIILDAAKVSGLGFDKSFSGKPTVFYGHAGVGKTYACKAAAKALGCDCRVIDGITYTPTDVHGQRMIPTDGSDFVKRYLPDWVKGLDTSKPAIINLSEITKAGPMVLKAMLNLLEERRSGDYELGRNWLFVLDGNLADSKGGDVDIIGPARTRCSQFIVSNDTETWLREYAEPNGIHFWITSFLRRALNMPEFPDGALNTWSPADNPAAWANERAWSHMSKLIEAGLSVDRWGPATLGNEVGRYFALHCKLQDQLPQWEQIRDNPDNAPVPDDVVACHFAGGMVAYHAEPRYMEAIATYFRRFPYETAATAMAEVAHRKPECRETRAFIRFRTDYKMSV